MNSSHKALLIAVIIYYANMHCMEKLPNFNIVNLLTNFTRIIPDGMEELRKKEKQIFCEGLFKLIAQYITIPAKENSFWVCTKECQKKRQNLFEYSICGYNVLKDIEKWPIKRTFYIATEKKKENILPAIFNPLPFNVICSCLNLINEYINSKEKRLILLSKQPLHEGCTGECKEEINAYKEEIFAFIIEKEKQKEIIESLEKKNHLSDIVVNAWYEHVKDHFLNIIKPNITFLLDTILVYVKENKMICKKDYKLLYTRIIILDKIIQENSSRIREGKLSGEVIAFINNRNDFFNKLFHEALKKDKLLITLSIIEQTKQLDSNGNFNTFRQFNI